MTHILNDFRSSPDAQSSSVTGRDQLIPENLQTAMSAAEGNAVSHATIAEETIKSANGKETPMSKTRTASRIWALGIVGCGLSLAAAAVLPLFAQDTGHQGHAPAQLVEDVRNATRV